MTTVWGPLGWMTLHSVSHNYPEVPSKSEQDLVSQWLDLFRDTITCAHCRGHFGEMLQQYRTMYPAYLSSRREFLLFVFRAHNTVNRRLDKPVYLTSDECEQVYRSNIASRPARDYRVAYLNHIMQNWKSMHDMTGISAVRKVQQMMQVETTYWGPRDTLPEPLTGESTAPLPAKTATGSQERPVFTAPSMAIGFRGGRLRFRR